MSRRVFLGWDEPLLVRVVDWLWERREEMAEWVVVVPTAQSGRRLREALAERGPCLAPRVVTPGWFLEVECAPGAAEVLAWVEALEEVDDWTEFSQVFPVAPDAGEGRGWAMALARSLVALERSLQEAALTLESGARRMGKSVEADRWGQLADLWRRKEAFLGSWGLRGRSRAIEDLARQPVAGKVVLAGVPDLPEAAAKRLEGADAVFLIAAPQSEDFDLWGRPLPDAWAERELPFPGTVELVADPRQQAARAVEQVAQAGTGAGDLALGTADEEVADALVEAFGRAGWRLHNPAGRRVSAERSWLSLWRAWLAKPGVAAAIDLLGAPESSGIVGGWRHQRVRELSIMRDQWLAATGEDVKRVEELEKPRHAGGEELPPPRAAETMEKLGVARGFFLRQPFGEAMARLLERVDPQGDWVGVRGWMQEMAEVIGRVSRDAGFWLDLLMAELPDPVPEVPEARVADVMGWLELLHEPGRHLIVCGMNEGRVPASAAGDAWLSDGVRELLGLTSDRRRASRDAYLFHALVASREKVGMLLGKSGGNGDALLPSRLLLAARGAELARRVKELFRDVEPPDAGMSWVADWKWRLPEVPVRARLSVTALRDFLACPLRFFLKHGVGMYGREGERVEWNARDFGNVIHLVLERWGRDAEAREFSKTEALEEWLLNELERVVTERHGASPPLAVRIQMDGARQRLGWFARQQACLRAEGWRVREVERKYVIDVDGVELVGKVDRIDEHEDGRVRVVDYKTYQEKKDVEKDHRLEMRANTRLPEHLENVDAVLCRNSKGKPARWINLQVPLYASFLGNVDELGYLVLGATEGETGLSLWPDFDTDDRDAAMSCARWIIAQVKAGNFGPAAERVQYDDFEVLAMGRPLGEMMERSADA